MGQFGLPTFKPQEQQGIDRVPAGEDQRKRPGGFTQPATGIHIS